MFELYNDVVTVKELCKMLKIGRNTAYELAGSGKFDTIKVKKQIRITKESIIRFIENKNGL